MPEETMDEYVARRCREWDERKAFTPEQWDEYVRRAEERYRRWRDGQHLHGRGPLPSEGGE